MIISEAGLAGYHLLFADGESLPPLSASPWGLETLLAEGLVYPVVFTATASLIVVCFAWLNSRRSFVHGLLPLRTRSVRLYPPSVSVLDVSLLYALIPPQKINLPYYMVEEGDVRCLYLVHSLLSDLYGRSRIRTIGEGDGRADQHELPNLVIISGPVWNATMSLYIGLCGSPVRFAWDGPDLKLLGPDGDEYTTTYIGNHRVKSCHGLLLGATQVIAGTEQRVVIIAGCSNLSTYAGAELVSRLDSDKVLRRELRKSRLRWGKKWAVVYRVDNWAEDPHLTGRIPTMQSGSLQLAIVRSFRTDSFAAPYEFRMDPKSGEDELTTK